MKNKNFMKLKYVSGNPQNAGFYTICPDCNSKSNRLEDILDQQSAITTIHINIIIVGKHMLDKFLSGENVKVNGEIAGRLHILRTLAGLSTLSKVGGYFEKVGGER
jgi:hypothetical protein